MPMTTIKPIVLMRRVGAFLWKGDTDAEAFVLRGRAGGRRSSWGCPLQAQQAARNETTPAALLELRPVLQGVEYDTPADQAAIDACKVESVLNDQKRAWATRCATVRGSCSGGL